MAYCPKCKSRNVAIVLSNELTFNVVEPFGCDWTILESSQDYEKRDAFTAVFKVPVKKNSEAVLTYKVRLKW